MRLLDDELDAAQRADYENHVRGCDDCRRELASLGRIIGFTNELRLRTPDDEFWNGYWSSVYRRCERNTGFIFLVAGLIAVFVYAVARAVTSPHFFSYEGISVTIILVGLLVIFISVVRERFHERVNDPYRGVKR